MTIIKLYKTCFVVCMGMAAFTVSCKKDGNPNKLPGVNPADYAGKIDGFSSSDEIFPANLVAYWPFDGSKNESKSGTAPTSTAGDAFIAGGVKGQALSLTAGYLYYATQFQKFKTDSLKSFSISSWVQIANNGSKRTMLFQLARPGMFNGNINFALNTNAATTVDNLTIQPTFLTIGGGTQDNLNSNIKPKISMTSWTHLVLTYNGTTGVFDIWADAVKVGAFPNRGTGNSLFKSYEPSEVIIGGNYNVIPGKTVSTDVTFAAMTGNIDEMRMFNIALPDAYIKALYNLGKAGK